MNITPTQYRVLKVIEDHIEREGYSPSQAQIAATMGRSKQNVQKHIQKMVDRGIITRLLGTPNSITVLQSTKQFN